MMMRWPNERTTPGVVPASTDETVVGMMPVAGRDDREYIERRHWALGTGRHTATNWEEEECMLLQSVW